MYTIRPIEMATHLVSVCGILNNLHLNCGILETRLYFSEHFVSNVYVILGSFYFSNDDSGTFTLESCK